MADEINRTADWEPGTLDKTRKNIGLIDEKEAQTEAVLKVAAEVLVEALNQIQLIRHHAVI